MRHQANNTPPSFPDRARLGRGLAAFAALTVAGLGVLFAFTYTGDLREVVHNLSAGFLLLATVAMVADIVIGAVRYQIFLRRIRPGTSLWLPIKADLANRFTGAVTPSQTGGGPAQVFILWKGGIPIPAALSFLAINFICTLVFFLIAGSLTAWALYDEFTNVGVQYLIKWGFVAFLAGLVFMVVGLARPDIIVRMIARVVRRLEARPGRWAQVTARAGRILMDSAEDYREKCMEFTRDAPGLVAASFVLTLVLYLNKFTLAWFIMRGLGVDGDYGLTLAVQALIQFVLYVAITPGGAFIAELVTGALMILLLPTSLLAPFTLAHRLFTVHLPAAVGAVVLAQALRPGARRADPASVRAVVTTLILIVVGGAAVTRAVAQDVERGPPVVMPTLEPLAARALAAELESKKELLREALDRGSVRPDKTAAAADFQEAVDLGRYLVAANSTDADAHYLLAVALGLRLETVGLREKISMGNETRLEAESALELDPDHAGAHHVMGRLHAGTMRLGRVARFVALRVLGAEAMEGVSWEQAEYHFTRARNLQPWNPRHSMELGALYIDTGRTALAFAELTRAIEAPVMETSDSLAVAQASALLTGLPCPGGRCVS